MLWIFMPKIFNVIKDGAANGGLIFLVTIMTFGVSIGYLTYGLVKKKKIYIIFSVLFFLPEIIFFIVLIITSKRVN